MGKHSSTFTFRDISNETSSLTVYNDAITAASIPGFLTQFGALKSALDAVSLCVMAKEKWVGDDTLLSNALPTDEYAERERGLRIFYEGQTSMKTFFVTVPGPDMSVLTRIGNTDMVELADGGAMAALVTAFEALVSSPDDPAENVTVIRAELVGRNN